MVRKKDVTHKYLKEILEYNSETGIFIWKFRKDMRAA
jgi:hypothetical protein